MQRPAQLLSTICLALICCAGAAPLAAAQESPVVAQDLKKLTASGKVYAAVWTRRSDSFTLQVVVPTPSPVAMRVTRAPEQNPQVPLQENSRIQVWLLKPDGTHISWTRRWETPAARKNCGRCIASEVNYSFPLSTSSEAVAAAIRIDSDFYIERLEQFGNEMR
jgi:hypothetical protein